MRTNEIPCVELSLSRDDVTWRLLKSCERNYNFSNNSESIDVGYLFDARDDGVCLRFRDARLARGLALESFARELGVARNEALAWETNERCPKYWLRKASELLQVDYDWLATGVRSDAAPSDESRTKATATLEEDRRAICELLRELIAILES